MGDRKQKGDSEYGDSDYDPRGLDFLRLEEGADPDAVPEEPRPVITSCVA